MQIRLRGKLLRVHGLYVRGCFTATGDDSIPAIPNYHGASSVVLVGNAGSSIWPAFCYSEEYRDGLDHPLDRWSRRIGESIAEELGGIALFPFEGPPYLPFLQWTRKAEQLENSPLGLAIHPRYGLWHAYRFALHLPFLIESEDCTKKTSPCLSCADQPCLTACPVDAFDKDIYRVTDCADFLRSDPDSACNLGGCLARHACPVGQGYAYKSEQAAFHMRAFLNARSD